MSVRTAGPIGGKLRSDVSGYLLAAQQVRRGYDVECERCGQFCDEGPGPCIAEQPTSHGAGVSYE